MSPVFCFALCLKNVNVWSMGGYLQTERRFVPQVIEEIKREIIEADNNEVFFTGYIDQDGIVVSVKAVARGNISEVPVHLAEARKCAVLIHNHPSGNLHPSSADLGVAQNCSQNAQGFYIINNTCSEVYCVLEPVKPVVIEKLNCDEASGFLSNNGPLAKISTSYEERPGQIELVKKIADVFNKNGIGVFEAGTGVGKSYAYLIPSILWASRNKERIVISTGTINLQQQLLEKDIPQAKKITGCDIKAVLVKGRQNFVCLRRLNDAAKDRELFNDDQEIIDKINDWAQETRTGSRSDLSFNVPDPVWARVQSESDGCFGMRCPHRENCFVMKMRKEAADANILVVNHHLLFADIESRMEGAGYDDAAVLPPYRRIVFDECHGIEDSATSFFSQRFTRFNLNRQLGYLFRSKKGSSAGYIFTIAALSQAEDRTAEIQMEVSEVKNALSNLELVSLELLENGYSARLHSGTSSRFVNILHSMTILQTHIANITGLTRDMLEGIDDEDKETPAVWEAKTVIGRLDDICAILQSFHSWQEHPDRVFWIEKRYLPPQPGIVQDNPYFVCFTSTPLSISSMMNQGVYEPMDSVVNVSATISISQKFDFWKHKTGVSFAESARVSEGQVDSPFPYEKNMFLAVPDDAPFPDNENFQLFVEDACTRLIEAARGRTLVLFTAMDSLRHACDTARTRLRNTGITVLRQGEEDRGRLLNTFKEDNASVLFATNSFWEGIDVPGDSLSQVIIVKLPFGVPSDPVFAARSELIQKKGGNPFMDLSVPESVIRFRQGFGRLIRRSDDRGVVVVLDRRIVEKRYGTMFTTSIPKTKRIYQPLEQIAIEVENFLK